MAFISCRLFTSKRLLLFLIISTFITTIMIQSKFILLSFHTIKKPINVTSKYPYLAVIVDDRATPLVVNAVINVLQHIPIDWKVQIITLEKHCSYYNESSLGPYIKTNRIFFTSLQQSSNGLPSDKYINPILTSASFWHQVQGDIVLLFQIDSVLCSNSPSKITDFLEYDFIGAPWLVGGCCNGGLSIRNRRKILEMLENNSIQYYSIYGNEDLWFTKNLPSFNARIAPISIAKTFSVETIYHPRPFGVHKPLINSIGLENMKKLCNECPEARSIVSHCQSVNTVSNLTKLV